MVFSDWLCYFGISLLTGQSMYKIDGVSDCCFLAVLTTLLLPII